MNSYIFDVFIVIHMYIYVCYMHTQYHSVQLNSVTQSCLTLCDPMNHSTPGLPVHHQLPEFTQTHAHRVGDAIQPSHPLSSPSPPAPKPSQHQGFSNESRLRTISLIYTKQQVLLVAFGRSTLYYLYYLCRE